MYSLDKDGIEVYPVFRPDALSKVNRLVTEGVLLRAPEFLPDTTITIPRTLGGFGALGLSSSFHHPDVRRLRATILAKSLPVLSQAFPTYNVQVLPDRVCSRLPGQSPQRELWHRDISPGCAPRSHVLGGFLNLSDKPMHFSCIPTTHRKDPYEGDAAGEQGNGYTLVHPVRVALYNKLRTLVEVPPGCFVCFFSNLIHEVHSSPAPEGYLKLFQGFYVTPSAVSLYDAMGFDASKAVADQAPFSTPSGQKPPLFSSNHQSIFKRKTFNAAPGFAVVEGLEGWSRYFVEHFPRKNGIVSRFCPSLRSLGSMYAAYTEEETSVAAGGPRLEWPNVEQFDEDGTTFTKTIKI